MPPQVCNFLTRRLNYDKFNIFAIEGFHCTQMRLPNNPLWFKVAFVASYGINTNQQLFKIVFLHPLLKESSLVRAQLTPGTGPIIVNMPFVTSQMGDFPICVALAHFLKSAAK